MSASEPSVEPQCAPFVLTIIRTGSSESRPMFDEDGARGVWGAERADDRTTYAAVIRTAAARDERFLCEWARLGDTFFDRTAAHRREHVALCLRLSADAPPGCSAWTLGTDPITWRILFTGAPAGNRALDGALSSPERVTASWQEYVLEARNGPLLALAPVSPEPVEVSRVG